MILEPIKPGERFHIHTIPLYLVDRLAHIYHPQVFVETGTYLGATVEHVKHLFDEVITIELSRELWENAQKLFAADEHVHTLCGDSAVLLPGVLADLKGRRALFWLDAHWSMGVTARGSADTAIVPELTAIADSGQRNHVLLIDDLNDFNGGNYPTVPELVRRVRDINPEYTIERLPIRRGVLVALPPLEDTP